MMKKVCIIYTGGTIGMVPTDNGYAPAPGYFGRQLQNIRDLGSPHMPAWDFVEFSPLLDSSNMAYHQWNDIASAIEQKYDAYDGFVILHGTDTMAYSAAALSFMLEGLDKPVVFTGSQIPLCELRSDAMDNLVTSLIIAGQGQRGLPVFRRPAASRQPRSQGVRRRIDRLRLTKLSPAGNRGH